MELEEEAVGYKIWSIGAFVTLEGHEKASKKLREK